MTKQINGVGEYHTVHIPAQHCKLLSIRYQSMFVSFITNGSGKELTILDKFSAHKYLGISEIQAVRAPLVTSCTYMTFYCTIFGKHIGLWFCSVVVCDTLLLTGYNMFKFIGMWAQC